MISYDMSLREYQQKKRLAIDFLFNTGNCGGVTCDSCPLVRNTPYANCYALEEQEPLLAIKIVSGILECAKQEAVDWTALKVDTKVYVRNDIYETWKPRHFKEYKDGKIYVFSQGRTSFTAIDETDNIGYNCGKLAE